MKPTFDVSKIVEAWRFLSHELGDLRKIRSEEQLQKVISLVDVLVEQQGEVEEGGFDASFAAYLEDLIEEYENETLGMAHAPPNEVLRGLMELNGLKQADLAREFGGQSVVSDVLAGKRAINARQAAALGARFKLSPAVFIAPVDPVQVAPVTDGGKSARRQPSVPSPAVICETVSLIRNILFTDSEQTGSFMARTPLGSKLLQSETEGMECSASTDTRSEPMQLRWMQ